MLIFLTQVYPPDAAAVGQYFESAAVRLAERGHEVMVYTADRDYNNPSIRYDGRSRHRNVRVVRLPFTSFGKRTLFHRLLGQGLYLMQVFFCLLFARKVSGVVLTTIPATTGILYVFLRIFRRFPTLYWVMDVNPDQAVAMRLVREDKLAVKLMRWANRRLLKACSKIIVLDRYMRQRVVSSLNKTKGRISEKTEILAPWSLEQHCQSIPRAENTFLKMHELGDKRCIFMYSGNHSWVHPLGTVLKAIRRKSHREDLTFLFVGGGRGKAEVEAFIEEECSLNTRSLPYQPLETLSHSLSAADVHLVVMGNEMVGIVHPCKIYGAMAVGKPVLFIGPRESHLGELVAENGFGWVVEHGDVEGLATLIDEIAAMPREEREAMGAKGREVLEKSYSADALARQFCDLVEGLPE